MAIQSQMAQNPNLNFHQLIPQQQQRHYFDPCINISNADNSVCNSSLFPDCRMQNYGDGANVRMVSNQNDIDSYINFQRRRMVQEQSKLELAYLIKSFETRKSQKDGQIRQLMLGMTELQHLNSTLQLENESLQTIAREKQDIIESLINQAAIQRQLHDINNNNYGLVEDAESCCDIDDAVSTRHRTEPSGIMRLICVGCGSREANMVFLPCRHLCACDVCENGMLLCPLCKEEKSSSIMTLVFS